MSPILLNETGVEFLLPETLKSQEYSKYDKWLMLFTAFGVLLPEYVLPVIALVFFTLMYHSFSAVTKKILFGKSGQMFFAYTIYMLVTIVWSKTRIHTLSTSLVWLTVFTVFLCLANTCDSKKKIENILISLSVSGAAASAVAVLQSIFATLNIGRFFPNPLYRILDNLFYKYVPSLGMPLNFPVNGASGTFESPLMLATFLILVMPISVFLAFFAGTKKRRKYCIAISLVIFIGLLLTYARAAIAALVISLVILAFSNKRTAAVLFPSAAVSGALLSVSIFAKEHQGLFESIGDWFKIKEWQICFQSIIANPIFGLGIGLKSVTDILSKNGSDHFHSYNLLIQIATESGIFGLLFFAAVVITILIDMYKIFRCGGWWKNFSIALLSSLVGFLIMSMFEFTLRTPKQLLYFVILLGITEASKRVSQKHKENYDAEAIKEHNKLLRNDLKA